MDGKSFAKLCKDSGILDSKSLHARDTPAHLPSARVARGGSEIRNCFTTHGFESLASNVRPPRPPHFLNQPSFSNGTLRPPHFVSHNTPFNAQAIGCASHTKRSSCRPSVLI
eukprot:1130055-Amphidinium_carterae.2